jgi:hypothetical protein
MLAGSGAEGEAPNMNADAVEGEGEVAGPKLNEGEGNGAASCPKCDPGMLAGSGAEGEAPNVNAGAGNVVDAAEAPNENVVPPAAGTAASPADCAPNEKVGLASAVLHFESNSSHKHAISSGTLHCDFAVAEFAKYVTPSSSLNRNHGLSPIRSPPSSLIASSSKSTRKLSLPPTQSRANLLKPA